MEGIHAMNLLSYKELMDKQLLKELLDDAEKIQNNPSSVSRSLEGKIIACLFFEPSTRTRLSFESATLRLGAKVIGIQHAADSSMYKGESLEDTIKTISGFADCIVMRHPEDGAAERAAKVSSVPVINAGDGSSQHPTQALLDLYTIRQHFRRLDNLNFAMVGDLLYGRTIHSLIPILAEYPGNTFHLIAPEQLKISEEHRKEFQELGVKFTESTDLNLNNIPKETDIVYMTRIQQERFPNKAEYEAIKGVYVLKPEAVQKLKPDSIIMHPLPRIDEIDIAVDADPRAKYFEQAHNGIFARMALLKNIFGK